MVQGGSRGKGRSLTRRRCEQAKLPVLVQRAASEGPRWTRAVGSQLACSHGEEKLTTAFLGMGCERAWREHFECAVLVQRTQLGINPGCPVEKTRSNMRRGVWGKKGIDSETARAASRDGLFEHPG